MEADLGPREADARRRRGGRVPAAGPVPPLPPPPEFPPPPPSGVESSNLPERSAHDRTEPRRTRRRRSALQLPALVSPVDLPEDAEGRVEFIVVRAPADRDEPPSTPTVEVPVDRATEALGAASGWIAVAVLAVVLILIFLIGYALVK